jgi:hypothetical protein
MRNNVGPLVIGVAARGRKIIDALARHGGVSTDGRFATPSGQRVERSKKAIVFILSVLSW